MIEEFKAANPGSIPGGGGGFGGGPGSGAERRGPEQDR